MLVWKRLHGLSGEENPSLEGDRRYFFKITATNQCYGQIDDSASRSGGLQTAELVNRRLKIAAP
jgi:hypothetical protein